MKITAKFFNSLLRLRPVRWQRVLEDSRLMRSLFQKVILISFDGLSKEYCIGAYLLTKKVNLGGDLDGCLLRFI